MKIKAVWVVGVLMLGGCKKQAETRQYVNGDLIQNITVNTDGSEMVGISVFMNGQFYVIHQSYRKRPRPLDEVYSYDVDISSGMPFGRIGK